jgi:hypothetical protein
MLVAFALVDDYVENTHVLLPEIHQRAIYVFSLDNTLNHLVREFLRRLRLSFCLLFLRAEIFRRKC